MPTIEDAVASTDVPKPKKTIGKRHFIAFLLFLGMSSAYLMRASMSVAIVAMVNHTIENELQSNSSKVDCPDITPFILEIPDQEGEFLWDSKAQGLILSSFFYGYVAAQIPCGLLTKKFGAKKFLGYGMMVNSVFALLVPYFARQSAFWLGACRFIQGLGEAPLAACTHTLLAQWIPPGERSRFGAFVYAGAQLGIILSMSLCGIIAEHLDWTAIFMIFGGVGMCWSLIFLGFASEDPQYDKKMAKDEQKYIMHQIWGSSSKKKEKPAVPVASILSSLPFYAILFAHSAQFYGYETFVNELPTYMKQVLNFSLQKNGLLSALPYLVMFICSNIFSFIADSLIASKKCGITIARKIFNTIGFFGPAISLIVVSNTNCHQIVTVTFLCVGLGLNGAVFSGFKINHLDIAPSFAGVLISITNCFASLLGTLAPIVTGSLIEEDHTIQNWRKVFSICVLLYFLAGFFYMYYGSGERQSWDSPQTGEIENAEQTEDLETIELKEVAQLPVT